jgi:hypothetical protein
MLRVIKAGSQNKANGFIFFYGIDFLGFQETEQ